MKLFTKFLLCMSLLLAACENNQIYIKETDNENQNNPSIVAGTAYVPEIEDVPLPNGFSTNGNAPIVYDTPYGRIVEAIAEGVSNTAEVKNFYENTLPQLGWNKKLSIYRGGLDMRFRKEDEELRINVRGDRAKITIKFSLYPDPDK